MTKEMQKNYNPTEVEQKWYKFWEDNKLFTPDEKSSAEAFTIVIPPPNVTGSLHMGHALDNSLQDVLIRYKRMKGFKTLWLPGTDHAGIATQNVVEKQLKKEGKKKDDLGREKFVQMVWDWKKEYGGRITSQLRRLGASCDWTRERFTMDEGLSRAVKREFVQLYKEGLIYRGKKIINWCPRCGTALSDIEVEHTTQKGKLWHIRYGDAIVATTRPETMLGDTAVAVNPRDERYKNLHGASLILPLVGRKMPVITDDFVDPEFGTGAVKVTPAHDPNDYDMGERHNLPKINILTEDAKITFAEFEEKEKEKVKELEGLDRFKAREKLVEMLKEAGYLEKIEDYENAIGRCYRCKEIVEPYLSDQWFVRVKPLAEVGIRVVEEGDIKFVPERWTKVYLQWMTNLKDWCISRQLWWGHQIPVWYCECGEIIVSEETPTKCPECGNSNLKQDPDVFDTWFSSALWPFSTLGWPEETNDLKTYYPTSVLITGYDIITFWVSRMIMTGMHFMKKEPFKTVFIHGLVRDVTGKKMSKSLGNVIDPIDVIDHAGADALRFALVSLVLGQGQDIKLSEQKITEAKSFATKIWNVARFVQMNQSRNVKQQVLETSDKWILSKYNRTIKEVTKLLDSFEFGVAAQKLYQFIWSDFCDWYIEFSKIRLYGEDQASKNTVASILMQILSGILKLLHPFMPFITQEIWSLLVSKNSIMLEKWPTANQSQLNDQAEEEIEKLKEVIASVRKIRSELKVPYSKEIEIVLVSNEKFDEETVKRFVKASKITLTTSLKEKIPQAVSQVVSSAEIYIPLAGLIDLEKEKARLKKEIDKNENDLAKSEQKLSNKNFIERAPQEKVQEEKNRKTQIEAKKKLLEERIKIL